MKLTLFERLILFTICQVMYIAGIDAKYREKLELFLYRIAQKGTLSEKDLEFFD